MRKPYVASMTDGDIEIWEETLRLGKKYGRPQQTKQYNFLATPDLKSKMECIDNHGRYGVTVNTHVQNVLTDAKKMIMFQFYMFEEMIQRHLLSEYKKKNALRSTCEVALIGSHC